MANHEFEKQLENYFFGSCITKYFNRIFNEWGTISGYSDGACT